MKWFSTKEKLPKDEQEVLLKCKGIVNLAKFQEKTNEFLLRNGEVLPVTDERIDWMQLVPPEQVK